MAEYITKIRTEVGDMQIDYRALAHLPKADSTLSQEGSFADAKAVGDMLSSITSVYTGVFTANGWSESIPYTQTITISGILPTDNPFVDINLSDVSDVLPILDEWTHVGRITATAVDTIVGYCYEEKPTIDIPIILKVVR